MNSTQNSKFNFTITNIYYFITNPNKFFELNPYFHNSNVPFYIIAILTIACKTLIYIATNNEPLSEYEMNHSIPGFGYHNLPLKIFIIKLIFSLLGTYICIWIISYFYSNLIKLFKGNSDYSKVTSVYALSYIILNINLLFEACYSLISKTTVELAGTSIKDIIINSINIFLPWQITFLILGISWISKLSKTKCTIIVCIMFTLTFSFNVGKQLVVNAAMISLSSAINGTVDKYKLNTNFTNQANQEDEKANTKEIIKTPK